MSALPANVRATFLLNFPSTVIGSGPVTIAKQNGIWTVGFSIAQLAQQTPPPANYATDFVLVYDSIANAFLKVPLSGIVPLTGQIETVPVTVNFNSANTDTQIPISLPPGYTRYKVAKVTISSASQTLTTATAGLFTAAAGGGTAIVTAASAITVSTAADNTLNNTQDMTVNNAGTQDYNITPLFFRVATAQGAAATGTVILTLQPLP